MQKRPYQKPELKEVKLVMEDTFLGSCRSSAGDSTASSRRANRACSRCTTTYTAS